MNTHDAGVIVWRDEWLSSSGLIDIHIPGRIADECTNDPL